MRTYQAEKAINEMFKGHVVNFSSKSGMKYFTISIGESKQENIDNYLDKVWGIFEDKIAQKSLRKNKSGFGVGKNIGQLGQQSLGLRRQSVFLSRTIVRFQSTLVKKKTS